MRSVVLALGVSLAAACSVDPTVATPTTDDIDTLPEAGSGHDTAGGDATTDAATPDASLLDASTADSAPVDASAVDTADSGCACGARSVCVHDVCAAARRVFLASIASNADLRGYMGADVVCGSLASAQSLGGTWMAWVSDSNSSPSTRFSQSSDPYRLLDGTLVANDWNDLTSGSISNAINVTESGSILNGSPVWTSTASDGSYIGAGCSNLSSGSSSGGTVTVGLSTGTDITWTVNAADPCDDAHPRIYCFEQ